MVGATQCSDRRLESSQTARSGARPREIRFCTGEFGANPRKVDTAAVAPRWKGRIALGAVAVLLLLVGCGVAYRWVGRLALEALETEAARYGVHLKECGVAIRPKELRFSECSFETVSGDAKGKFTTLTLTLDGLEPSDARVSGISATVRRPADANAVELGIPLTPIPLRLDDASVLLDVGGARVELADLHWHSTAGRGEATFRGPLGSAGTVSFTQDVIRVRGTAGRAPLHLDAASTPKRVTINFRLRDYAPRAMLGASETSLFTPRSRVDADVQLVLPRSTSTARPSGRFVFEMNGLQLPPPPHLSGISLGSDLQLRGRLSANRALDRWDATKLTASLGGIELQGDGNINLSTTPSTSELQLFGALSCANLAKTALAARAGTNAAELGRAMSQKFIHGHVGVIVSGKADLRAGASGFQLQQVLTGGCGLKLTDALLLPRIPARVLKQLPSWLSRLDQSPGAQTSRNWELALPGLPRLTQPLVPVEH